MDILLSAAALALELTAVRLPGRGCYGAAAAAYLALQPGWGLVLLISGVALRTLLRRGEVASSLIPPVLAGLALHPWFPEGALALPWVRLLVAVHLFVGAHWLLKAPPGMLPFLVVTAAGPAWVGNPWSFLLLPVLQYGYHLAAWREEARREHYLGRRLHNTEAALEQAGQELRHQQEADAELRAALRGMDRLLKAAVAISRAAENTGAVLDRTEEHLQQLVPHQARVLVWNQQVLRHEHFPEPPWELLEQAWSSRSPVLAQEVLVVGFQAEGGPRGGVVLRRPEPFERLERDLVTVLCFVLAAALENARLHAETVQAYRKLQDSEAQLVQAGKLAGIGQLAAGVAHELNTPLGSLRLSIESAARALPARVEQAATRLENASSTLQRAQAIVDKLLYYARQGTQPGRPTDLNGVARDTLELVGGEDVRLEEGELRPVVCRPDEIQQVLINLLLNARDAVREAQGTEPIRIRTRMEEDAAVLEVEDAGCGIPHEIQSRVFEPFFTTKPVGRGTGLGLSLSHQIVQQHHGSLALRSEPGRGSVFTVRLPAWRAAR